MKRFLQRFRQRRHPGVDHLPGLPRRPRRVPDGQEPLLGSPGVAQQRKFFRPPRHRRPTSLIQLRFPAEQQEAVVL